MKKFLVFLFAVFAMLAAYAAELDGLIDARAELWKMSGQTVMKNYPDLFVWMDQGRTRLRYNVRENRAPLTLFGRRVLEVIIDVKDEKICELNVSVYNRGDAGEMPKKTFDALLDAAENRLAGLAGRENVPQTQNVSVEGSRIRSKVWRTDAYDVVMRWSYTRSVPEFLAIDFFPAGGAPKSLREGLKTTVATSELDKRLINDEDGSRYMTVPMVDQGAKGYCVAATVERILRYYGSNIDQHMIAKLAESDAQRGTNINKIVEVLEGNQVKLGIRYRKLYQYSDLDTYSDFKGMINSYNTIARRMKLKKIDFNDYVYIVDRTKYLVLRRFDEVARFQGVPGAPQKRQRRQQGFPRGGEGEHRRGDSALLVDLHLSGRRRQRRFGVRHAYADHHRLQHENRGDHLLRQLGRRA